ncbi:sigma factor G inhibitor Gin [Haloimpatiens lingqiaonensis]|uniref:sigma factor G inhibitor Gin n=1 Tax=Haloimpatiens lingqiaonensis TaxID=1380675 RepID=UPI0010FCE707|nr:sigma factor G inhibitor Gin [Haloimpatiens lingqiaonensis]
MSKRNCIICSKPLNNGIIINGRGICKKCEEKIVRCNIETDFYEYYKNCIRKNLTADLLKGEDLVCQDYRY